MCDLFCGVFVEDAAMWEFVALVFVFVVRFDQGDDAGVGRLLEPRECCGDDEALRGPTGVDDDEVDAASRDDIARRCGVEAV